MPKHISVGVCIHSFSQQAVHSAHWAGGFVRHKAVLTKCQREGSICAAGEVHSFSLYPVILLTRLFQLIYSSCIL